MQVVARVDHGEGEGLGPVHAHHAIVGRLLIGGERVGTLVRITASFSIDPNDAPINHSLLFGQMANWHLVLDANPIPLIQLRRRQILDRLQNIIRLC